jgi:non-canonical (house-cleaning) NTP pyrophosphatase
MQTGFYQGCDFFLRNFDYGKIMNTLPLISIGNSQIIAKAKQRANEAQQSKNTDYAIGFAEGILEVDGDIYTSIWCAILEDEGGLSLGGGMHIRLTSHLMEKFNNNTLTEADLEEFLQSLFENPYERIVEYALLGFKD